MATILSIIFVYFIVLLIIGYLAQRQERKTAEDYFLAGRSIGSLVMTVSVFSTLFSAFTFVALPGLVYRTGFGFIPGILVANILFPVVIFLIGYKIWLAGKKFHFITPTELFKHRFNSTGVEICCFRGHGAAGDSLHLDPADGWGIRPRRHYSGHDSLCGRRRHHHRRDDHLFGDGRLPRNCLGRHLPGHHHAGRFGARRWWRWPGWLVASVPAPTASSPSCRVT